MGVCRGPAELDHPGLALRGADARTAAVATWGGAAPLLVQSSTLALLWVGCAPVCVRCVPSSGCWVGVFVGGVVSFQCRHLKRGLGGAVGAPPVLWGSVCRGVGEESLPFSSPPVHPYRSAPRRYILTVQAPAVTAPPVRFPPVQSRRTGSCQEAGGAVPRAGNCRAIPNKKSPSNHSPTNK